VCFFFFKHYSSHDSPQVLLGCWPSMTPDSRNYDLEYSCHEDLRNAGTAVNWQTCGNRDINVSSSCHVSSRCHMRICQMYVARENKNSKNSFFERKSNWQLEFYTTFYLILVLVLFLNRKIVFSSFSACLTERVICESKVMLPENQLPDRKVRCNFHIVTPNLPPLQSPISHNVPFVPHLPKTHKFSTIWTWLFAPEAVNNQILIILYFEHIFFSHWKSYKFVIYWHF